ncbi:MAG: hypothetical protein Q8R15_05280 [Candidatus Micrarchaeota archaeon]|nr:hypothetical protein [Candidatus Micrarchaeota archaeon]
MEFTFTEKSITLDKELNSLDRFTISFCKKLDKHKVKYCLVSGYVAIVFGRSRATEDVDMLVEKMPFEQFAELWKEIRTELDCMNAFSEKEAYEMLCDGCGLRFHEFNQPLPNMEFKFIKTITDKYTVENSLELRLNKHILKISPLEIQIAFKLYLGSEKDIEDARHLYKIFKDNLNMSKLSNSFVLLKVPHEKVDLLERIN